MSARTTARLRRRIEMRGLRSKASGNPLLRRRTLSPGFAVARQT